jgi:hypothetical protein
VEGGEVVRFGSRVPNFDSNFRCWGGFGG